MREEEFRTRAEKIHCPESLRRKILARQGDGSYLFWQFPDGLMFQIRHCEDLVAGRYLPPVPVFQPVEHTQQTYAYQQTMPQYQPYFQQQPVKRKKSNNNAALITAALATLIIVGIGAIIFALRSGNPGDLATTLSGGNPAAGVPSNCVAGMPSTELEFGPWKGTDGAEYFVPKKSPSLNQEASAVLFTEADMLRFYGQTSIATSSGVYSGQQAFVGSIMFSTIKSNAIQETDPRFQQVYNALSASIGPEKFQPCTDPSLAGYKYLVLPALSGVSVQPTTTPMASGANESQSSSVSGQPANNAAQVTPTSAMVIEIVPTTTLGPIPGATVAYLVENYGTYPTPTLGPMPASEVERLIYIAQTQQAMATPTPYIPKIDFNSLILTAQTTPQP